MRVKAARSLLFLPATSPQLLPKATERGADALIVDLEDSVPADRKAEARPLAAAALLAGACALHLGRRIRDTAGLGMFFLHVDGTWSVRRGSDEVVFKPLAVRAWPGAVLVDFVIDDHRYSMVISRRSAGTDAFRRLQVRVRAFALEPAA